MPSFTHVYFYLLVNKKVREKVHIYLKIIREWHGYKFDQRFKAPSNLS